jgi:hypothetical protein
MKFHNFISTTVTILLTIAAAQAEVVPNRWEKMEALTPGTAVIVNLAGGERLECTFNKIGSDEVLFNELNGNERRLPKKGVLRIDTAAVVRDRLRNGILMGTLIGAAGGIAGMVIYGNSTTNGPVGWKDEGGLYLLGAGLVGGGVGAAAGAILDASIKHREVLYRK